MKRNFVFAGAILVSSLFLKAQKTDSVFKKKIIDKTEIDIFYSHYNQDGNNSAVTGGIGTEKLTVYAPSIKIVRTKKNNSYSFKGGADIISSASTDNIDFVMSSASRLDMRSHVNIGYAHDFSKKRILVKAATGLSIESDYLSLPVNFGTTYTSRDKMQIFNCDFQFYFDDLRWGRLNENYHRPVRLIYPSELRYKTWFETYKRNSYSVKLGFQQVLNKRNVLGIFPEFTLQQGLLSTPFHRIYFSDGKVGIETLPQLRQKALLGIKLNSFVGGITILKNRIDLYADDFGIRGLALENESSFKLTPFFTLSPSFRIDFQKGSKFFKPFGLHSQNESFFTSDYDLSSMETYQFGLAIRYLALKSLGKAAVFNDVKLKYAYYFRSNQLNAHLFSVLFTGIVDHTLKKKTKKP
jgi:hypothetical protein